MDNSLIERKRAMRARYHALRQERPDWFVNETRGFEILVADTGMNDAEEAAWGVLKDAQAKGQAPAHANREWVMVGVLAEDSWGVVVRDAVRTPNGELRVYRREMPSPGRSNGVVAVARRGKEIALINHHRHALRRFLWEFPRGFGRGGETCEETLDRQLREELGVAPTKMRQLGMIHPDGGKIGDAVCMMTGEISKVGALELAEAIDECKFVTAAEFRRCIKANDLTDGLTLAAFAKADADGLFED